MENRLNVDSSGHMNSMQDYSKVRSSVAFGCTSTRERHVFPSLARITTEDALYLL
jgi:hypothetical protein